jgi:hypothetical protein
MRWDIENIDIPVVQIGNIDTAFFNSFLVRDFPGAPPRFNRTIVVNIGGPEEYNYFNEIRRNSTLMLDQLPGSSGFRPLTPPVESSNSN